LPETEELKRPEPGDQAGDNSPTPDDDQADDHEAIQAKKRLYRHDRYASKCGERPPEDPGKGSLFNWCRGEPNPFPEERSA